MIAPAVSLRHGVSYWFASLAAMLRFDIGRSRDWAKMMLLIQTFMGAGMAMIYGFFYPHISATTATYIVTGIPTVALIPLGFVMLPGAVGQQKTQGTYEYIWSLPAPRSAQAASTFLLYTLLALPGMVLALLAASWRYGVHLAVSPLLVPAALLCSLTAVTVGFGLAISVRNPLVINLVCNALVFVVLLFSPIVYPASQLPGWLRAVHAVLPFEHMADVMRAGLTAGIVHAPGGSFLVLAGWVAVGCAATAWALLRRA